MNPEAKKRSKMDAYIAWFMKWMPESFFICLILTLLIAVLAFIFCDVPVYSLNPDTVSIVSSWVDGFWGLLAFTMQMTVLLATGNAVAASPPARKLLSKLAQIPRTRTQYIILGVAISALLGYIHWGLGMMGAIVLGRELLAQARLRGVKLHMPVLVAAVFLAFLPGSAGISGAAALYSATPDYLAGLVPDAYKDSVPDSVPLSQSVASPDFIIFLILCMVIPIVFCIIMHPKENDKIRELNDEMLNEILSAQEKIEIARNTPAEKMNACRWIMYLIGGIGLIYSVIALGRAGLTGLDLDSFNFLFLSLGLVLCANYGPEYYCKLIRDGIGGTWGFILQFPFYAGIFGIISETGLGMVISHLFTSISTETTWPVIAYIYSAILNIAVPSGGSKFIIEAPYIVPTTIDLGANLDTIIKAYQMGDGTTNLIIPFFALPYLANFKLKFNEIVAYTVPPVAIIFVMTIVYLLII